MRKYICRLTNNQLLPSFPLQFHGIFWVQQNQNNFWSDITSFFTALKLLSISFSDSYKSFGDVLVVSKNFKHANGSWPKWCLKYTEIIMAFKGGRFLEERK